MYHYVYRITNIVENKHYYGKRSSKILPEYDLGIHYFSSSSNEYFILDQKENKQNYFYKIIFSTNSSKEALRLEAKLHNKLDVANNENFYNIVKSSNNSLGFDPSTKRYVIDNDNNGYYVDKDDIRIKNNELHYPNKNMLVVKDKNGNMFRVKTNDERYLNGDLVSVNKGKKGSKKQKEIASIISSNTIPVVDLNGNKFRVKVNHPDYGITLKHCATREVLYKDKNGNNFWSKDRLNKDNLTIVYMGGKRSDYSFHTPWGKFDSVKDAHFHCPNENISFCNIKNWCRNYNKIVNYRCKIYELYGSETIGKSFKDIGFYRERSN